MVNLSAFIRFHGLRAPERLAILYEDQRIGYGELYRRTEALAGFLAGRGIGVGDVVAVLMKNSPAFVELALATSYLGAVFLPINYRLAAAEVDYIVEDAGAELVLADEELAGAVAGVPGRLLLDAQAQGDSRHLAGEAVAPAECYRTPDDLFRLMYTSGTTDRPKGRLEMPKSPGRSAAIASISSWMELSKTRCSILALTNETSCTSYVSGWSVTLPTS